MLCSFWCWDIFFRVIKNFSLFLDKRQKSIYLSLKAFTYPSQSLILMKTAARDEIQINLILRGR